MSTNPLVDVIPAAYRKYLYALLFLAGLGIAAWQAADGNWKVFVGALVTAIVHGLAASNTATTKHAKRT